MPAIGGHCSPAWQAVSALGKVSAMMLEGEPLLEDAAILSLVHALRPDAGVFPRDTDPRGQTGDLPDLYRAYHLDVDAAAEPALRR